MPNPNLIPGPTGPTGPTGATGPAGPTGAAGSSSGPGGQYYLLCRWYPDDGYGRMEPLFNKPYPTPEAAKADWEADSPWQAAFIAGPFPIVEWLEGSF